jgi:adenylate kinase family enzyme
MKIHLFGAAGSGVTSLGHYLAQQTGMPYFDSDDYYWEQSEPPFTIRRKPNERDRRLREALAGCAHWILGGSVISWGQAWLSAFDLAVFVWTPPEVRMARLHQREYERYGDVILTDPARHQQSQEFLQWAAGYDDNTARGRTLAAHEAWMQLLSCPVLCIRDTASVAERAAVVLAKLQKLHP